MTTHTFIHFCASGNRLTSVYKHDGYLWARQQEWLSKPNTRDDFEQWFFNSKILGWMHEIAYEVAYGDK